MIRAAIVGVGGRMGSLIAKLVNQAEDMVVVAAAEHESHPLCGQSSNSDSLLHIVALEQLDLSTVDVVFDFTAPQSFLQALSLAEEAGCAVVSGTTGLTAEQVSAMHVAAKRIPIVYSPNMARGVNIFFHALKSLSQQFGMDYGVEVVEIHHCHKKDAPSGTAKRIMEFIGRPVPCHSLRIGEVIGEHQVHFAGNGERVTFTHQAETREAFAQGALLAARFVTKQKPGLYDMWQVLELAP